MFYWDAILLLVLSTKCWSYAKLCYYKWKKNKTFSMFICVGYVVNRNAHKKHEQQQQQQQKQAQQWITASCYRHWNRLMFIMFLYIFQDVCIKTKKKKVKMKMKNVFSIIIIITNYDYDCNYKYLMTQINKHNTKNNINIWEIFINLLKLIYIYIHYIKMLLLLNKNEAKCLKTRTNQKKKIERWNQISTLAVTAKL